MHARRPHPPHRRRRIRPMLALTPLFLADRAAFLIAGCALLLVMVISAVVLGAAFARRVSVRRSCARTLDQILRIVPWYKASVEADRER